MNSISLRTVLAEHLKKEDKPKKPGEELSSEEKVTNAFLALDDAINEALLELPDSKRITRQLLREYTSTLRAIRRKK